MSLTDVDFRSACGALWQRILRSNREDLFGPDAAGFRNRNRHEGDRLAQPGYVGRDYAPGGMLFLSMYPGGGPDGGRGPDDRRMYLLLKELRDAGDEDRSPAFENLNAMLAELMARWKMYTKFIAPVLEGTGTSLNAVAFANLLKWRWDGSNGVRSAYRTAWHDHTGEQIELLAPGFVVAVGVDAGRLFQEWYRGPARVEIIPRVIGDNIGQRGRDAIARICAGTISAA